MEERLKPAIVFFARDFLSVAFSGIFLEREDIELVFITTCEKETNAVKLRCPRGHIVQLDTVTVRTECYLSQTNANPSHDRFMRSWSSREINYIKSLCETVASDIIHNWDVKLYLDEPVSGYINEFFNEFFTRNSVLCCHFQTCWLPGYMFFVQDKAQLEPLEVNALENGADLVTEHIELRKQQLSVPAYVLDYSSFTIRLKDIIKNIVAVIFKLIFRRSAFYINKDFMPNMRHTYCLLSSFYTKYTTVKSISRDKKYVFYPLHYEPECILGYFSKYQRQVEIVDQLLDFLPHDYEIILKEHPSQPGALGIRDWSKVRKNKRVNIINGTAKFDELSDLNLKVLTLGSTLGLEAALHGHEVYTLGGVHYAHAPGIHRIDKVEDIFSADVGAMVSQSDLMDWYANFLNRYCFKCDLDTKAPNFVTFRSVLEQYL